MISCMIIDDEKHCVNLIEEHVKQVSFLKLKYSTTKVLDTINVVLNEKIDLIFLDIQMPQMSGLDFIKAIGGKSNVILCTAHPEFALEGYDNNVVDYLLKPVAFPRFMQAVLKAKKILMPEVESLLHKVNARDHIFVKGELKGKLIRIDFSEVHYIENAANYVAFTANKKRTLVLTTMKELENTLPHEQFIRVHNSFIVNISLITSVEGNTITLKGEQRKIEIGGTYKAALKNILEQI